MRPVKVTPWLRNQRSQAPHKRHWTGDDMGGAVIVTRFQRNNYITVTRRRQPLFRDGRPCDIPIQTLTLSPLVELTGHTCMQ